VYVETLAGMGGEQMPVASIKISLASLLHEGDAEIHAAVLAEILWQSFAVGSAPNSLQARFLVKSGWAVSGVRRMYMSPGKRKSASHVKKSGKRATQEASINVSHQICQEGGLIKGTLRRVDRCSPTMRPFGIVSH
jgi:hypothetical protein